MTIVAAMPSSARVVRDALRVVARRGGDHAARPRRSGARCARKLRGAALLERARELQVLELQPELGARDLGERAGGRRRGLGRRRRGSSRRRPRCRRASTADPWPHPATGGLSRSDNDRYHAGMALPVTRPASSTRDRLLAAAVEVFVEQGYEGARVQDIARAAGLTTGAIYANFRGKAELLFDAIGARAGAEMDAMLAEARGREVARAARDARRPPAAPARAGAAADRRGRRGPPRRPSWPRRAARPARRARGACSSTSSSERRRDGAIDPALDTDAFAASASRSRWARSSCARCTRPPPDGDSWHALITRLLDAVSEENTQ